MLIHELAQPVAAVLNYVDAAQRRLTGPVPDVPAALDDLERARSLIERAARIVEHQRAALRRRPARDMAVDLRACVLSAADALQDELRAVGARLRVRRGRPPRVKGDATELGLVVSNLLRNAISAVRGAPPDERRIDVGALARAGRVWVVVGDRGCGLPPGSADRVLDPLFTTWPEGTGLGLAICRAIVEGHGGMFRVRPRAGRGAVFGFCLEQSS